MARGIDRKSDPVLVGLVGRLKEAGRTNEAPIWRDIAKRLEKPTKARVVVNLSRIDRYANEGDTVLVPGKLLAAGAITKKVKVAAYHFSLAAMEKIEAAGGTCVGIDELAASDPQGTNVKILG